MRYQVRRRLVPHLHVQERDGRVDGHKTAAISTTGKFEDVRHRIREERGDRA